MTRDEQLAWAAGLFEGEGSVVLINTGEHKGKQYWQLRAKLNMTDEDVVRRFHLIMGVGTVVYVKPRQPHHLPQWQWHVGRPGDWLLVTRQLYRFLGLRRRSRIDELRVRHTLLTKR